MLDNEVNIEVQNIFNEDALSMNDSDVVIDNQSEVQNEDKNE